MTRKLMALVLCIVLVLAATPAFALELLSAGDTYPIDTDKTLNVYFQDGMDPHETYKDWTESPFHTNLIKQTGININWMFPTAGSDAATYTNMLLADPTNLPHIMKVYFMDSAQDYLDRGIIWDLTPYLEEYAPAYYAFLKSNEAYDKALKTDAGQYYCFGFFREDGGWNDTYLGPVVRTDWLEECGLDYPTTISEFENVIRTFYETYGAKFTFAWSRFKTTGLSGAFGAYGASDMQFFVKDGEVGLAQKEEEWRNYMSWLNMMWEEGLLDQDSLTETDTTIKTKVHDGKIGISITSMGQMNNWNLEEANAGNVGTWVGSVYPTGDDGTLSMVFGGPGIGTNTIVVTKTADEETMKLCLQLLDYAYTQEGFYFWNFGVQGESWDFDENGKPAYLPEILEENKGVTDFTVKYGGTTWSGCDIQATQLLYMKNSTAAVEANDTWFYNNIDVTSNWIWPIGASFTVAESDELSTIKSPISTYITESFANFISGAIDIDDDAAWENYLSTLESMNVDRMLEIYQGCYERYLER